MSAKELQKDVEDLKIALRTIGRIMVDENLKETHRRQRILGILQMWECEPVVTPEDARRD